MSGIGIGISPFLMRGGSSSTPPPVSYLRATGGWIAFANGKKYHAFTSTYDLDVIELSTDPANNAYSGIAFGGGGSGAQGGGTASGGGSAGQFLLLSGTFSSATTYPAAVGLGGAAIVLPSFGLGNDGNDSSFNGATAVKGLGGGGYNLSVNSANGKNGRNGSGAGTYRTAGAIGGTGGTGTNFNGGNGVAYTGGSNYSAGGGAGDGGIGGNAVLGKAGDGGVGIETDFFDGVDVPGITAFFGGATRKFCAGAGGSSDVGGDITGGLGGDGGGGDGSVRDARVCTAGEENTGSGGGGSTEGNTGKGGDGLIAISYPHALPSITPEVMFQADTDFTRYDSFTAIELLDDTYFLGGDRYGANPGDLAESDMLFYTTSNFNTLTLKSTVTPGAGITFVGGPNLAQRANGDIVCIYLEGNFAVGTTQISMIVSTDLGATWGAKTVLIPAISGTYVALAGRKIFKTSTGRWVFTFDKNTDLDPDLGVYKGCTITSDDEFLTHTVETFELDSPDGQCLESDLFETTPGLVVRAFRSKIGPCYFSESTDDCETWDTPYNSGLPVVIKQIGQPLTLPSTTTIEKLDNGNLVAIINTVTREHLMLCYSTDGGVTWSNFWQINYVSGEQVIGVCSIQVDDYLHLHYSVSDGSLLSEYEQRIKLTDYI